MQPFSPRTFPQPKIYVAGHRGLVGSALLRALAARGFTNVVVRTHAELDLLDQREVANFFAREKPDFVFLAAARVGGIHANNTRRAEFIYENLQIQNNVIHQSYLHQVTRLLFLGSSCIYPRLCPQPMPEDSLLTGPLEETNSPYALAKIAGIEMCWSYNRQYGTRFLPVMPTNLYGANDNFDLESSHVLPALIRKVHLTKLANDGDREGILRDELRFGAIPAVLRQHLGIDAAGGLKGRGRHPLVVWGTGKPLREFLHVDDMAEGCMLLMGEDWEKLVASCDEDRVKPLFNLGFGCDVSIRELAECVARVIDFPGDLVFDASRPDGTPKKLLDVSRMHSLGWKAGIDLETGVRMTWDWYRSQLEPS